MTSSSGNILVVGAILLVIILAIILRKWVIDSRAQTRCLARAQGNHDSLTTAKSIRTYALDEIKVATRDFRIRIGVGATSYVYLAELGDGRFGAVKRVMEEKGGCQKMFLDEVSILLRISHPNLVALLGFCLDKGEQLLLLEYIPNKSLFDRLHNHKSKSSGCLSWSSRLSIALDIAYALDYLHSVADPPDVDVMKRLLDPKLNDQVNLEQIRVVVHVANMALLENSIARPDMAEIAYWISTCIKLPETNLPV
ncbi:hypothetical protein E3N88_27123 [Mikania micrantha]|uniref:non-specific serine/threonine protein kinase n=1 Tax=Mikania micrantha TaxID=192012 RepID=A0A5N6MYR8_9ASTR|nr:hypothetical protein E3N88_27123 [Mikania micrantha]